MRRLLPEPVPLLAPVSRWLATAAACIAVLSVIATRFGGIPVGNGLFLLGLAIVLAVVAVVAAFATFASVWQTGAPGAGIATKGLVLALLVLAWPGYLAVVAALLPVQNDVTTDLADPPSFSRSRAALDARQGFVPAEYDRLRGTELVDDDMGLKTIIIEQSPEAVMLLAQRAAANLGWLVIDSASPLGRTATGRIDAIARSFLFRLPDDITIRIRPGVEDTRIDVRSVSRIGRHDFGMNTKHVRDFAREIELLASAR